MLVILVEHGYLDLAQFPQKKWDGIRQFFNRLEKPLVILSDFFRVP